MIKETENTSYICPPLILIEQCRIAARGKELVKPFNWELKHDQVWVVVGAGGGGKEAFRDALAGYGNTLFETTAATESQYANMLTESTVCVSLESAAALIHEERTRDESDYIEGGVDHGRTARVYISEVLAQTPQEQQHLASRLESMPETRLCGIEAILDRGIKYLSTGEIRRTLICRALLSGKRFLILSEPFAGLDIQSRTMLTHFFNSIAHRQAETSQSGGLPRVMLFMERYTEIPDAVTHVAEFAEGALLFSGTRAEYEKFSAQNSSDRSGAEQKRKQDLVCEVRSLQTERAAAYSENSANTDSAPLVEMYNVHVGWGDKTVLDGLTWTLRAGEHWLIRGPNGSGKTTLLELISGDNMQVFCNDVRLFGKRRGSGETVWEIKARMGIVSYRLHLEYRMVGGTDLESVIISGLKDTIGLYEPKSDLDRQTAARWLALGSFSGREHEPFSSLSYGEQRALLILRAAVKCPPLLILDEPCHGLDEEQRARVLSLLETIAQGGTSTLLHVTHDPTEVLPCEHHILELQPGKSPMYRILEQEST